MLVSEEIDSHLTSTIVETSLDEYTQQSTFTCIDCAD